MAHMEIPATLAACGAPKFDQAGSSINSDNSHSTRALQVARLARRCALTAAMAAIIAPLAYGEVSR
jgi:hypothetical protein